MSSIKKQSTAGVHRIRTDPDSVLWMSLDKTELLGLLEVLVKSGEESSRKLLRQMIILLEDALSLSDGQKLALNKIILCVKYKKAWGPELLRNNIFKAAAAMDVHLPHAVFASEHIGYLGGEVRSSTKKQSTARVLKIASDPDSFLWKSLDKRELIELSQELDKSGEKASRDLLRQQIIPLLEDALSLSEGQKLALSKILLCVKYKKAWSPELLRNNIFKAAAAMDVHLPHAVFASETSSGGLTQKEKLDLVGLEVPAASGGDFGHRILGYDADTDDFIVRYIEWSTGKFLEPKSRIDAYKITYRYQIDKARKVVKQPISRQLQNKALTTFEHVLNSALVRWDEKEGEKPGYNKYTVWHVRDGMDKIMKAVKQRMKSGVTPVSQLWEIWKEETEKQFFTDVIKEIPKMYRKFDAIMEREKKGGTWL